MKAAVPPGPEIDIALADALTLLVARAGDVIKALGKDQLAVRAKSDLSPVTAADEASERVIAAGLRDILPALPVISEEHDSRAVPAAADAFVLVDPLDGTKEFIAGRNDFTVNLAIVNGRYPVAGFIGLPAFDLVYRGIVNHGAERVTIDHRGGAPTCGTRTPIRTRRAPAAGLVVALSRSHPDPATEAMVARLSVGERMVAGSSVKFCRVAEGEADVYPRLGRTREWDIAAGHAIVVAAGGLVTRPGGEPLTYGFAQREYAVDGFIAWGDPNAARRPG